MVLSIRRGQSPKVTRRWKYSFFQSPSASWSSGVAEKAKVSEKAISALRRYIAPVHKGRHMAAYAPTICRDKCATNAWQRNAEFRPSPKKKPKNAFLDFSERGKIPMKWGEMEENTFPREIAWLDVFLAWEAQGKHEYSGIFGSSATLFQEKVVSSRIKQRNMIPEGNTLEEIRERERIIREFLSPPSSTNKKGWYKTILIFAPTAWRRVTLWRVMLCWRGLGATHMHRPFTTYISDDKGSNYNWNVQVKQMFFCNRWQ